MWRSRSGFRTRSRPTLGGDLRRGVPHGLRTGFSAIPVIPSERAMLPSALATIAESPDCNASRAASTDSDVAVSRENLYRALSGETAPEFGTVTKVLRALGIKLVARAKPDKAAKRVCGSASWPQTMERLRKSRWVNARNGRSRPAGYCSDYKCSHSGTISGDQWPDDIRLSD
jgi:probable addiction module antidote protein